MNFNTISSRENDSKSTLNAKRVAGVLAVAGAVFAGGCENSGSNEVRHYSAEAGGSSSEQVPYGKECKEHPDAVSSTAIESLSQINEKPERLGFMLRDMIKYKSGDYSTFTVNFNDEQAEQLIEGIELVKSNLLREHHDPIQITVLNPGGWDALNIDRSNGTFEGDLCVGADEELNNSASSEE